MIWTESIEYEASSEILTGISFFNTIQTVDKKPIRHKTYKIMFKFITNSIGKIFGTKYDRDIASYTPMVNEINEEFGRLKNISDDELRDKTIQFRARIAEHLAGVDEDIKNLDEESKSEKDLFRKEENKNNDLQLNDLSFSKQFFFMFS